MNKYGVLFVCLGNICRSPTAEVVFNKLLKERKLASKFLVEARGTGHWHAGEGAHPDTARVAEENGVPLTNHVARQLARDDFQRFELLVAMDRSNKRDILSLNVDTTARIICLREYDPEPDSLDVPDPYFSTDGFREVYQIIHRSCENLLESLVLELSE